ncbi:MAG: DUF86 domain-containing protein [Longimicrobiales bacterium]|nr:DUF86 domain-containing protein [Longimicrobiales bacterium]
MTRGTRILLGDILEAAELLERYTRDLTFEQFAEDTEKQDAVARRLEVIGEATKALPQDLRERYPAVPWREIAGARDVLIHEYFRIDLELAWQMVQEDVPDLAEQVRTILEDLKGK